VLAQSCSTSVKSTVAGSADVCPSSSITPHAAASPVNATRLVQLANVAIDSQENALDCRVDSASLAQHDVCDGIKSEDGAGHSCDDAVAGSLLTDGQLSRGNSSSSPSSSSSSSAVMTYEGCTISNEN